MINEVVLVGKIKSIEELTNSKKRLLLEVERPFKDGEERKYDVFTCQLWNSIFNKIISFSNKGDLLAIRGRMVNEENNIVVMAEKIVVLNKSKQNI